MSWFRRKRKPTEPKNADEPCTLPREVVDACMSYLSGRTRDLKACSLVCKVWSHAAQRILFNTVFLTQSMSKYSRLGKALQRSPHLITHIHTLTLHRDDRVKTSMFESICMQPFTHLDTVTIVHSNPMDIATAHVLGQLLSLRTLRRVDMDCYFLEPTLFPVIWATCSPTVKHLDLRTCSGTLDPIPSLVHTAASKPVMLDSLRLGRSNNIDVWMAPESSPFDCSQLFILSLETSQAFSRWPRVTPNPHTIESLDFSAHGSVGVDLSLFPNLRFLRIHSISALSAGKVRNCLITITPACRIQQIVLRLDLPRVYMCEQMDFQIVKLPMSQLPSVGIETVDVEYDYWALHFPKLRARELLHRTNPNWFETQIERRDAILRRPP